MTTKNWDEEESTLEEGDEEMSKWFQYHRLYSQEEKRLLISKVVLVTLETTFANHIYQCQNVLYRQCQGGGIGAQITGVLELSWMCGWIWSARH